jgi:hypothetical protein
MINDRDNEPFERDLKHPKEVVTIRFEVPNDKPPTKEKVRELVDQFLNRSAGKIE